MLSKSTIRFIRSLKSGKSRGSSGLFVAEGTKTVLELLTSSLSIHSVYATIDWLNHYSIYLQKVTDRCHPITGKEMESISYLVTPQDVLAIAGIPETSLIPGELGNQLVIMLDEIRDPGNMGTIIRTADWFGIRNILCSPGCVDVYNPKVVQSSMGSIARVNVHYTVLKDFLSHSNPSLTIYGCMLEGLDIRNATLENKGIILLGNESTGISPELIPCIQVRLTIPSFSSSAGIPFATAESLNAAQACSIICFAFRSQRR
ncbi:MAG TPA: RNA methyltransferase [Bacteroidales bacterium]|nr:RNA methyltransferase [Bacteroidales bacterium]